MERQPLMQRMRVWFVGARQPALGAADAAVLGYPAPGHSAPRPSVEGAGSPAEKRAYLARVEEAADLVRHGRELNALVLSRETSDRRFNGAQIIVVELEVDDPEDDAEGPRRIVYEHVFGPAAARRWKPGSDIPIWIDRRDPLRIYAGR
jgi:hypothetical protein